MLLAQNNGCDDLEMPQTVQIRLVAHLVDGALIHRLRNYGEDVYRYTRDGGKGLGEVDLEEVDSAKDQFSVHRVANRKVRGLCRWLEEEGARQNLRIVAAASRPPHS